MNTRTYRLIQLNLPVPPMFEEACGYKGSNRYVAFWWSAESDKLAISDGLLTIHGAHWGAWLVFRWHPRVAEALFAFHLGSSEKNAIHYLVLDRKKRMFYIGHRDDVALFLMNSLAEAGLDPFEDIQGIVEEFKAEQSRHFGEDERVRRQRAEKKLSRWLEENF